MESCQPLRAGLAKPRRREGAPIAAYVVSAFLLPMPPWIVAAFLFLIVWRGRWAPRRHSRLSDRRNPVHGRRASVALQAAHVVSARILDRYRALETLELDFGVFIAERRRARVIVFRRIDVARTAASACRERAHPFQRVGIILRGSFLEPRSRRD